MPLSTEAKLIKRVRSVNEILFNRAIRHGLFIERLKTSEALKIVRFLDSELLPDLRDQLNRLERLKSRGRDINPERFKTVQKLFAATDGLIQGAMQDAYKLTTTSLFEIALTEAQFHAALLRSAVPSGLAFEFTIPPTPLLRSIVTSRPFGGRLLKDWYGDLAASTRRGVRQAVNIGIAEGEAVPAIAKRVARVADISKRHAATIVRTAVSHVTNHAATETFKENDDVIKEELFVATLDTRTTPVCRAYDGKRFKVGEGPIPPLHMNCRSRRAPVTKSWKELGIDLDEAPEGTRASMDGQVPASTTYGEWLRKQPKSIQDEALGPRRAELFRAGKVKIEGFVDRQGRALSLEEIRKREGLD